MLLSDIVNAKFISLLLKWNFDDISFVFTDTPDSVTWSLTYVSAHVRASVRMPYLWQHRQWSSSSPSLSFGCSHIRTNSCPLRLLWDRLANVLRTSMLHANCLCDCMHDHKYTQLENRMDAHTYTDVCVCSPTVRVYHYLVRYQCVDRVVWIRAESRPFSPHTKFLNYIHFVFVRVHCQSETVNWFLPIVVVVALEHFQKLLDKQQVCACIQSSFRDHVSVCASK